MDIREVLKTLVKIPGVFLRTSVKFKFSMFTTQNRVNCDDFNMTVI